VRRTSGVVTAGAIDCTEVSINKCAWKRFVAEFLMDQPVVKAVLGKPEAVGAISSIELFTAEVSQALSSGCILRILSGFC